MKAIALLSGGLDSTLAVRLILDQGKEDNNLQPILVPKPEKKTLEQYLL